jgi:hypothetical protein
MNLLEARDIPATRSEVRGTLNYLVPGSEKPVTYMYVQPSGASTRTGQYRPYTVSIRNAREAIGKPSLDTQGFILRDHVSVVRDFYNDDEVRERYYPEIERLVCEETGAARAFMFDHTIRSVAWRDRGVREPVRIVHNDYTPISGPQRVRDLLDSQEAKQRLQRRFAVINVWRPIVDVVRDTPLAICDANSMAPSDFVATEMRYRDRTGETYSISYNPNHRWYYVPDMRRDEVLIFKCFDSADDGRARYGAHSAFDDPTATSETAERESIEARLLVFF